MRTQNLSSSSSSSSRFQPSRPHTVQTVWVLQFCLSIDKFSFVPLLALLSLRFPSPCLPILSSSSSSSYARFTPSRQNSNKLDSYIWWQIRRKNNFPFTQKNNNGNIHETKILRNKTYDVNDLLIMISATITILCNKRNYNLSDVASICDYTECTNVAQSKNL